LSIDPENAAVRTAYLETLKTDPLFNRTPDILFGTGGATFAGGTVGQYEDVLDYDNGEFVGAPDIDVSAVKISDWLIAKGFPSRTAPMGSALNKAEKWELVNYDMSHPIEGFMTDFNRWPSIQSDGAKIWKHSDWKNVPYVHVYKLFDKITGKAD
jgi:hypothetical protein